MDFYEDDEPVEKVVEAFERGEKKRTRPPYEVEYDVDLPTQGRQVRRMTMRVVQPVGYRCQHASLSFGEGLIKNAPTTGCGCTMQPVYA